MSSSLRVLIVEDRPSDARLMVAELRQAGMDIEWERVESEADYIVKLDAGFDLVLSDFCLPQFDGARALQILRERNLEIPFIFVSGNIGEDVAVNAMQQGATDYLLKDRLARLGPAVQRALDQKLLRDKSRKIENAIKTSELRYKGVVESAPDCIIVIDDAGRILEFNPAAQRVFGFSQDEIVGSELAESLIPHRYRAAHRAGMQRYLSQGKPQILNRRMEIQVLRKGGAEFPAELSISSNGDHPQTFTGFLRDITERKRAEAMLQDNEARLVRAQAVARIGSWETELATLRVTWSDETYRIFEVQPDQELMTHQRFMELVHPEDRAVFDEAFFQSHSHRSPARITHRVVTPGGRVKFLEECWQTQEDDRGEPIQVVGTCQDVTLRKQAEEILLLRDRAIQAVNLGVVITDPSLPDNPIIYASPGFERLTGYASSEILDRNCRFLQGRETDPKAVAQIRTAVRSAEPCVVELLNYRKDGTPFWNELSMSPVRDESARVTHFVGVQNDVTERRRLEEQLRQSQKMEAFGQLAGGIAHDFNNILTVINGYSEIIYSTLPAESPLQDAAREISLAGKRATSLTRQLLTFSRRQIVEVKVLDLNTVVTDTAKMLQRLIGEDVELEFVAEPALRPVRADRSQIEQILLNLAVNARDAMPLGGKLTIETTNAEVDETYTQTRAELHPGSYVVLNVSDTGCGMDAATRSRIFEPFFTTKELGKGTGLGLATVFGIVKQGAGQISVDSEPGCGTTFRIYLPAVNESVSARRSHSKGKSPDQGAETILLVEDEPSLRTLARRILEAKGYTILEAGHGADALQLAEKHVGSLHLLVTDVVMPVMGGRELAERLAAMRPGMKILYLSGYTDDAVVRHGILHAEASFLQKPYTPTSLVQKVQEVLDHPAK